MPQISFVGEFGVQAGLAIIGESFNKASQIQGESGS